MKIILALLATVAATSASAQTSSMVTLKQAVTLPTIENGVPTTEFCFDLKARAATNASFCDERPDTTRLCSVHLYGAEGVSVLPSGIQFRVTDEFGPSVSRDWSEKTSHYTLHMEAAQGAQSFKGVIMCTHSTRGWFAPSLFTTEEVNQSLGTLLSIQ